MVPTMRGLRFRDQPSPSGSEFNTPRASMVARASSITDDEGQFVTPRADAAGAFGSMNPVHMQGPSFQVCYIQVPYAQYTLLDPLCLSLSVSGRCWTKLLCMLVHAALPHLHVSTCCLQCLSTIYRCCNQPDYDMGTCNLWPQHKSWPASC